jgi:glycosyltransferase involved in cell wall biosynthesis
LSVVSVVSEQQTTVVVPTRDRVALLAETLRSIDAQQPRPAVIVADDGSRDATPALLAGRDVTVVRNDLGGWGAGEARNAGLAHVSTPFVAFVDSDDLLVPGALAALAAVLAERPDAPFAFGLGLAAARDAAGWSPRGLIQPMPGENPGSSGAIYARNFVPSSGALVRTETIRAAGGYDASLVFSEDLDLWLRLAEQGTPAHLSRLVVIHRRHGGNRHLSAAAQADEETITRCAAARPGFDGDLSARLGAQLCEELLEAGRARSVGIGGAALRRLFITRPRRAAIARAAARHFTRRRAAGHAAAKLWERDGELRTWLAGYD